MLFVSFDEVLVGIDCDDGISNQELYPESIKYKTWDRK